MYKLALFGYSGGGKTALFRKLTGKNDDVYDPMKPNLAVGRYNDAALEKVAAAAGTKKTVYPEFGIYDFKGMPSSDGFPDDYLKNLSSMDAIICTVNNYQGDSDPVKDCNSLLMELVLYDAARIEKMLERAEKPNSGLGERLLKVLGEGLKLLESEKRLSSLDSDNLGLLNGMEFLTVKPLLFFVNGNSVPCGISLPAVLSDVSVLDPVDFYPAIIKAMSLVTFYTVKGDISQGWLVPGSLNARESAGKVHKDIEKGFIRVATVNYKDFLGAGGWQKAKASGLLKFLGPNSSISDMDVVEFYFH